MYNKATYFLGIDCILWKCTYIDWAKQTYAGFDINISLVPLLMDKQVNSIIGSKLRNMP